VGTSHPSVTDAPLIEPLLLGLATGSTIDAKEGVREYFKATEEFLRYQHFKVRTGLLAQPVSHPEYKDPEGDKSVLDVQYQKYWQVHVAPDMALEAM
jgi:platelet-activating factor acetylhydrolase